eukprot:m.1638569 g.1638569  ORF g.1638569 m.1638569 type:complete len:403 (+) comp28776_c0_seq1:134-1342(+)
MTDTSVVSEQDKAPARGLEYTDKDGTVMEWDAKQRAYFPKLGQDFMAQYQMGYGATANPWTAHQTAEGYTYYYNGTTKVTQWEMPEGFVAPSALPATAGGQQQLSYEQLVDQQRIAELNTDETAEPEKKKSKKKKDGDKQEEGFFKMDDKKNTFVYVQGLPTEDFDLEKFSAFMSKCGIIALDTEGQPRVKLYTNEDGSLKGDGRCCYLKVESVNLALTLLDQDEITPGHVVTVKRAEFNAKANYDPSSKPDKKQKQKKKNKGKDPRALQEKRLLTWHDDTVKEVRKKATGVVVIKHMFEPKEFDDEPMYLNDIRDDLQSECSKFGVVKKIMIFDRHPEGVVSIKFEDMQSAMRCIDKMHKRFFAGKELHAELWDGHTSYKIEESDLEREQRLKKWEADLEE